MKRFLIVLLWTLLAASLLGQASDSAPTGAAAVFAEFDRMAGLTLWPHFEPKKIPLAIYDGERTFLIRHPSPPSGFVKQGEVWIYPGQHPLMRANTHVDLAGVPTATLLLPPEGHGDARHWAATMIHESFHVFQAKRHADWSGNEMDLYAYPVADAEALALRRLETESLRRARTAPKREDAACWARRALEMRRDRAARLPASSVAYERGTELNEGLASFVQSLALGEAAGPELPAAEWSAEDVRLRIYAVGPAEAFLLDRFDPSWRGKLEAKTAGLDEMLDASLSGQTVAACAFTAEEAATARERAKQDAGRVSQDRRAQREELLSRAGWRLVLLAGAQPLWPQGFDPWNIAPLGNGELIHRRWVKLSNDGGTLEILNRESLTEGAGANPLANGIRKVTLTGFAMEPKISKNEDSLVIEAEGVTAKLKGATVERGEKVVTVKIP
ncbi:MAG TPA: hypothetical protein VGS07_29380 [Thermoanaerobaculia bacterium]|jgi:hypothetical protein|nr:hypothetical protein [Thermoanaerobaculia bacterium]